MWKFGKKSNQQPSKPEVPPELQQYYYAQQAKVARTRLILSALVLAVLIVAAIFAGLWLHGRATNNPSQLATNQSTQHQKSKPNNQSNQNNNKSIPVSTPKTTTQAPKTQTPSSVMPNTGPGSGILFIAIGAGLLGAILYRIRQIRSVRLSD
ncbi:MAG: hypothetical protein ACREF5_01415 [Candidatus Saccharimonadales bacterium]